MKAVARLRSMRAVLGLCVVFCGDPAALEARAMVMHGRLWRFQQQALHGSLHPKGARQREAGHQQTRVVAGTFSRTRDLVRGAVPSTVAA